MALTREQILAARKDRKPTRLEVPEWGGEVYIRVLSMQDQMAWGDVDAKELPLRVLIAALVDEAGVAIFQEGDEEELAKEDFPVITRVFAEAARLNGLSTKELDEAMASFDRAPDESSSTA